MGAIDLRKLCGAYGLGLLLTAIPGTVGPLPNSAIAIGGLALLGGVISLGVRGWPKGWIWVLGGLVALGAALYFQVRLPQPGRQDVSLLLSAPEAPSASVKIHGYVESSPRLTPRQTLQFQLRAIEQLPLSETDPPAADSLPQTVTGKLYVTVPLLQGTGLYPGQEVTVTGKLYRPQGAANPGGFDFQAYLAQSGIFAGLRGEGVHQETERRSPPLLWSLRQRILRAQIQGLGSPAGSVVSAMVMGRKAVDIPPTLRDQFLQVGLAHTLAASGFHVSLLLGVVLALTAPTRPGVKLVVGLLSLAVYGGITGAQPSVLRAALMGGTALVGLTIDRKTKPLGLLLLTATLLLLINPLWIWDLGFQLSFLSTLGLLITAPALVQRLDWLPPRLVAPIAVPIAAFLWTLPLQLFTFGVVSPYAIPLNILAMPLIMGVSLGGMMISLVALISPLVGSVLATGLTFPVRALLGLVEWTTQLPGSQWAIGHITPGQMIVLYGVGILLWQVPQGRRYASWAALFSLSLILLPGWYRTAHLVQVTLLATQEPVVVIQHRGQVGMVYGGTEADVTYAVLPFLRQQGINHLDWAIDPTLSHAEGWLRLLQTQPIHQFYTAPALLNGMAASKPETPGSPESNAFLQEALLTQLQTQPEALLPLPATPLALGHPPLQLLRHEGAIVQLQVEGQSWLLANLPEGGEARVASLPAQALWGGSAAWLHPSALAQLQPQGAIVSSSLVPPETQQWFQSHAVPLYQTSHHGAVQWTPQGGLTPFRAKVAPE